MLNKRLRGSTIMEIMIVLILIGIAAAMAAPPFIRRIQSQQLYTTGQRIASLFDYARKEALRTGHVSYIYPAYFRTNGLINGPATSWQKSNGLVAFNDDLSNGEEGDVGQYNQGEQFRTIQAPATAQLSANSFMSDENPDTHPSEVGFIILPNGEVRISDDYHNNVRGQSGKEARIVLRSKRSSKICQVVWLDAAGHGNNCPIGISSKDVSARQRSVCACQHQQD